MPSPLKIAAISASSSSVKFTSCCKPYMYAKVRLAFDTPTSGAVKEALEHQVAEYEYRMNVRIDSGEELV